ncbi:MAG: hypothetical protein GWP19_01800 [Planctomycetia bacterium]|nr:hypothetical protein [Planctomycetia bacterium]
MGITLSEKELEKLRSIKIHSLLGIKDDGRRIMIRCPFHNERDASLAIYQDNSFYCFGCQANGQNAIDFTMRLGYEFVEALDELVKHI